MDATLFKKVSETGVFLVSFAKILQNTSRWLFLIGATPLLQYTHSHKNQSNLSSSVISQF